MWGLPWGFMLLIPISCFLYRNKGRRLAQELKISRRALLWYIFFLLLGGFITVSAASFYLNMGGLVALIFACRLLLHLPPAKRLRALISAAAAGLFSFCFQAGWFWWLARLPFPTGWLLPLLSGALAAVLALDSSTAATALILGLLGGNTAALLYLNGGLLATEFGSVSCINGILLALLCCLLLSRLLSHLQESPTGEGDKRRLT